MGVGKFDRKLPLPPHGPVEIKGPFNPQDPAVKAAKVIFLIVQGEGKDAVVIDSEGTWERGRDDDLWSGTVPRRGPKAGGGEGDLHVGFARGIAQSVVIKPGELFTDDGGHERFEPPSIESLTWCATFKFV